MYRRRRAKAHEIILTEVLAERLHGCPAKFRDVVIIDKQRIYILALQNHPTASTCYAWSAAIPDPTGRRNYAILHQPPIDSPEKALRSVPLPQASKHSSSTAGVDMAALEEAYMLHVEELSKTSRFSKETRPELPSYLTSVTRSLLLWLLILIGPILLWEFWTRLAP